MYEQRTLPPLTRRAFNLRMLRHFMLAVAFVGISLGVGMLGYRYFERDQVATWHDAFLDAAMLLGGMGPVHIPKTECGKIFAGLFALYAGLVFLIAAGLLFAPVFHRLLHRFHWEQAARNTPTSSTPSHDGSKVSKV